MTSAANTFIFASPCGNTKITYYPDAPGPLVEGLPPGALFEYAGPEGKLVFRSAQISRQDTPAGQFLSVVLKPEFDAGSLVLSLFLPPVEVGEGGAEAFRTYALKTRHAGSVVRPGAQMTYETEALEGLAKLQVMPR